MATATDTTPREQPAESRALAVFKEIRDVLAPYPAERFHHLLPTAFQERSPLWRPAPTVVVVDPSDERDVYPTPGSGKKMHEVGPNDSLCFRSSTLERIANAVGIDFDNERIEWSPAEPYVCTAYVGGWYTDSLGQRRRVTGSATEDLRDGSVAAAIAASPKQLGTARQFIQERALSRARNRCIRKTANLRSSYKKSELLVLEDGKAKPKPFVALRFRLDESDPDAKRAIIAQATGASEFVFGGRAPELPEGRPLDAGHGGPEGDDEVLEGNVVETTAVAGPKEPDVVEPEDLKAEPDPAAAREARALEIRARVDKLRVDLRWGRDAREKPSSDKQIGLVAGQIAHAVGADKQWSTEQKKAVRRAVLAWLFGPFSDYAEISNDRSSVAIDWAKESPAEVRELLEFLADRQEDVAQAHALLMQQGELLGGAR